METIFMFTHFIQILTIIINIQSEQLQINGKNHNYLWEHFVAVELEHLR